MTLWLTKVTVGYKPAYIGACLQYTSSKAAFKGGQCRFSKKKRKYELYVLTKCYHKKTSEESFDKGCFVVQRDSSNYKKLSEQHWPNCYTKNYSELVVVL